MIGFDINEINLITSHALFKSLDLNGNGKIYKRDLQNALGSKGILNDDPRTKLTFSKLNELKDNDPINRELFHEIISDNITLMKEP